jgi:hypothetical protein
MIGIQSEARRARLLPSLALLFFALGCSESEVAADGLGGTAGAGGGVAEPVACSVEAGLFADAVVDHAFGPGQDVGQDRFPELVLGPPQGAGDGAGSTNQVVSLGDGGFVELSFGVHGIVDVAGPDFIVFENAFFVGGDPENPYAELGEVSVSQDGTDWVAFPCTTREYPYDSCAGWHPVLANAESNALDPTDVDVAGGDAFDLADVGLPWVRYVRIDDIVDEKQLTFDLDAVAVVHPGCFD